MTEHARQRVIEKKITFGVIVGTRGFFNPKHAENGRKEIIAKLDEKGYGYHILPVDATPYGAVETLADAQKYAKLFREKQDDIDGIIVILPNFGDEQGIVETISRSKLNVPVLVQAYNDSTTAVDVKGRRDAFCGKLSVCNNLYQYGIPFTGTTSHTVDVNTKEFDADLDYFARVCRTVKGLSTARIGTIGARPKPFQTVRFSEKIMQATGITMVPVDLSEIIGAANKIDDTHATVKDKLEKIRAYGKIPNTIVEQNIVKQAKLSVAIDNWNVENQIDATAIQCWSSIQDNYGCATCLSMSMMGEELMPSACEVDAAGVVSMYALLLAAGTPPGFLDWNNNYGADKNMCVCTHCSNYPKSFMGREIEISNLDILGMTLGAERCFGAIKGHVAAGEMTYFRMSTDDVNGRIVSYVGEGEFTDDPFPMDGGIAVCRVPRLQSLMRHLTTNGFEHHVAMVRGRYGAVVQEAVESYLGWDNYSHELPEE